MLIISSALSMRSAYSPIIHASEALASGSSSASKFSHSVDMMPSYLCGYLRKMSYHNPINKSSQCTCIKSYLDNNNGFLNHVAHTCVDQIQKDINAALRCLFNLDGTTTNSIDRLSYKINIYFIGVSLHTISMMIGSPRTFPIHLLFQFAQQLIYITIVAKPDKNFQLLKFDIRRIIVATEEDAHLVR